MLIFKFRVAVSETDVPFVLLKVRLHVALVFGASLPSVLPESSTKVTPGQML